MWLKLASILEKMLWVVDMNDRQSEGGENYAITNGKESEKLCERYRLSSLFIIRIIEHPRIFNKIIE